MREAGQSWEDRLAYAIKQAVEQNEAENSASVLYNRALSWGVCPSCLTHTLRERSIPLHYFFGRPRYVCTACGQGFNKKSLDYRFLSDGDW